jgi:ABC-type sugar transport system permease subunit
MFDRRFTFWVLFLPPLIWLAAFFLFPILLMAAFSFRADTHGKLFSAWVLGFNQYVNVWTGEGCACSASPR